MSIDREDVKRIAELARLEIPEDRIERTARELSAVLDYAAALRRLDLEGCEPTVFAGLGAAGPAPLRADALDDVRRLTPETALAAAPEHEDDAFLVPPVVENLNP
ncbi:MAG: Asp-tRNA(Asn)/Glu-tRNA(Gln) amidotransferase subunit GatC [Candidatus Eisenbacteria bacterium]|uniref:Aspartyl/glutamyl-tRNA(Asn/Gln) amidotransferase subunit C n=1 Tax=Eiseniibacteriota bacterium TaxID=2212470 RepID=A0A9D6L5X7_UNCEI|nr:Asp-tRNA(Asn)/Glu-tRNA(Gln) amidotransferase subunit GatC [Candidatus Eisenbacteria bacterium]MBI3539221.1 Asp-tRNA(Asn)/Glu-tRNA(Gln) amidotransferase subunit GatC [Candidatus Eisenbacteria bacterium]